MTMTAPLEVPPSSWLPPETPAMFHGFRRWLKERAETHRAAEEACKTTDGANASADRAEECEAIVKAIGEFWLGEPRRRP